MIKTFVSYHHKNDQAYKEALVTWANSAGLIDDYSVSTPNFDTSERDLRGSRRSMLEISMG